MSIGTTNQLFNHPVLHEGARLLEQLAILDARLSLRLLP
jgi:hypothetical protein